MVSNGAEGKFLAGGEFPVVINTSNGGTVGPSVTYKEFGVRLSFLPKIAPNGEINLKIAQEVSELDFANAVTLTGFRIPALRTRKAESSLQLADGQTFALAGLIDNKISKQVSKVPAPGGHPHPGCPVPEHPVPEQRDRARHPGDAEDRPPAGKGKDARAPDGPGETGRHRPVDAAVAPRYRGRGGARC